METDQFLDPAIDDWNDAIASRFFSPAQQGRDVTLCLDVGSAADILPGYGAAELIEAIELECDSLPPGERNPLALARDRLNAWNRNGRQGFPPYLSVLAILVLGADHGGGEFAEHAYWSRLESLRRSHAPESEPISNDRPIVETLFRDLTHWSCVECRGELGRFELRRLGQWRFVGLIRAQSLLSASDRRALEHAFLESGLCSTRPPSRAELVRTCLGAASSLRASTRHLLETWPNGGTVERLVDAIEDHLMAWDGSVVTAEGQRQARLPVLPIIIQFYQRRDGTLRPVLRIDAGDHSITNEVSLSTSGGGQLLAIFDSGHLSEPLTSTDSEEAVDATSVRWEAGLRLTAESGSALSGAVMPGRPIRFFVREGRAWAEESMLPAAGPCLIACCRAEWDAVLAWLRRIFPEDQFRHLRDVPVPRGWEIVRCNAVPQNAQARDAFPRPGLVGSDSPSIQLSGGVKTEQGSYYAFALPDIRVRGGGPRVDVRIAEAFDAGGRPAATPRLARLEQDDGTFTWRITATEPAWDSLSAVRVEAVDQQRTTVAATTIVVEAGEVCTGAPLTRDLWGRTPATAGSTRITGLSVDENTGEPPAIGEPIGLALPASAKLTETNRFTRVLAARTTVRWQTAVRIARSFFDGREFGDAWRAARSTSMQFEAMRVLGFLEVLEDEDGHFAKVAALPRSLHIAPSHVNTGMGFLVQAVASGTYSARDLDALCQAARRRGVFLHVQAQPAGYWLVPDRVSLLSSDVAPFFEIEEATGCVLIRRPFPTRCVEFLQAPELFLEEAQWRPGPPPHAERRLVFDVSQCRSRPEAEVEGDLVLAECREPHGIGRWSYWLFDRRLNRHALCSRQLGRWIVAKTRPDGPRALPVSATGDLFLPLELRPPLLVERALCACSGMAPEIVVFRHQDRLVGARAHAAVDWRSLGLCAPPAVPAEWLTGAHVYTGHWLRYQRVTTSPLVQGKSEPRVLLPFALPVVKVSSLDTALLPI